MSMNLNKFLASFFGLGFFPLASGTLASAGGMIVYLFLYKNTVAYLGVTILFLAIGFLTGGRVEKALGHKDPSIVVIDEVAGLMIALYLLPVTFPVMMTAFFLFRAFDMFKVYPADKFEEYAGGVGIMMDDVIAGLYTNIVMHIALMLKDSILY